MKIGIIGSAGGSAFEEIFRILSDNASSSDHQLYVITDRECGLENTCSKNNIPYCRIEEKQNTEFSERAKAVFEDFGGVDLVLLYYSRFITRELYEAYPCFNVHPALLPAFKGLSPIRKFIKGGACFFGATLHLVDETEDGGPIIGQVSMPVPRSVTEEQLNKYSFVHKVYLGLLAIELMALKKIHLMGNNSQLQLSNDLKFTDRCNPAIQSSYFLNKIKDLQVREGVEVVM